MPIRSFRDRRTAAIFDGAAVRRLPVDLVQRARNKLLQIDAVPEVEELQEPPSNRLERLGGDRRGQYSVRVNMQWRICFRWVDGGAEDVEFVDYH